MILGGCVFSCISDASVSVAGTGGVSPPTHIEVTSRPLSVLERIGNAVSGSAGGGIVMPAGVPAVGFLCFGLYGRKNKGTKK